MSKGVRSVLLRYVLPVAVFAVILLISLGVMRFFSFRLDLTILIIALIIVTAWLGGRGPGLLVVAVFEIVIILYTGGPFSWRLVFQSLNRLVLFGSLV
jgi:hypothetical protein